MPVHQRTGRFANAWSRFANFGSINGTQHKDLRVKFEQWEGDMPNDDYLNQMVPKNVCCKATVIACSSTYHWSFQTDQRRFSRHLAVLVDWKDFWVKGTYYESALKFQGKMVPMSQSESRIAMFSLVPRDSLTTTRETSYVESFSKEDDILTPTVWSFWWFFHAV